MTTSRSGERAAPESTARRGPLADLAALGAFLALLELRHPYFFLEDDNRTSQLALFVHSLRGLRHGELPLYNFHQFLGMPTFAVGSVPFLYPPVYLAVLASQALFGHPDAAVDLLVAAHFAAGLWGMHRLLDELGLSRGAAAFGAASWPLSSMAVYTASSWWNVAGVIAYLPWTILLALRLVRRPRLSTFLALVLVRTAFLYVGHIQLFVYAVLFEVLCAGVAAIATMERALAPVVRRLAPYALSLYVTAALGLPFAQPLWHQAAGSTERASALSYLAFSGGSFNLVSWLVGTVDPYRADPAYFELPIGFVFERAFPYLSFMGHAALLLLVLAPLVLRRAAATRASVPVQAFALPLLVALLWTTGALDRALFHVPVFNRFRWHFRVEVFVVFFALVLAAMALAALEHAARDRGGEHAARGLTAAALAIQLLGFAALYGLGPPRPFNHRRILERPPLSEPLVPRLGHGRIVSIGNNSADPYSSAELGFDYASLFGLFHYAGYGNVLSARHAAIVSGLEDPEKQRPRHDGVFKPTTVPLERFERWAVAWYVVGKNGEDPVETRRYREQLEGRGLRLVAEDARRAVYEDPAADPLLALDGTGPREDLAPEVGGRSLTVHFAPAPTTRRLVASFLAVPGFTARAGDGRALPLRPDALARMSITVPPGVDTVRLVYDEMALDAGVRNGALLLAPLLILGPWVWRRRRRVRSAALESAPS